MATTERSHLPGDITFADTGGAGIVRAAHGALKNWAMTIDGKTMTSIKDFAEYGEDETITGEKITLETTIEGPSLEIQAVLRGWDIVAQGYIPYFSEPVGPAVAGVFPALTDVPILANSEVVRKSSTADGKTITDRLVNVAAGPVAGEYTIVPATGVISVEAGYVLYAVVNYVSYDAAVGAMLVSDYAATVDPLDIIIMERATEFVLGQKGGTALKLEKCQIIKKPDDGGSLETPNDATIRFNVAGAVRKSTYTS